LRLDGRERPRQRALLACAQFIKRRQKPHGPATDSTPR
jgi:hypothetical protein